MKPVKFSMSDDGGTISVTSLGCDGNLVYLWDMTFNEAGKMLNDFGRAYADARTKQEQANRTKVFESLCSIDQVKALLSVGALDEGGE